MRGNKRGRSTGWVGKFETECHSEKNKIPTGKTTVRWPFVNNGEKKCIKKKEDSSRTAPRPLWWKATKDVVRSLSIKKKKTKLNNAYQKVVQVIVFLFWGITRNVHFINLLYWGNENIILNLSSSFQPTIAAFWQKTSRAEGKVQAPKSSLSQLPAVFESQHLVKTNKLQKEYKWLAALRIKMAEEE